MVLTYRGTAQDRRLRPYSNYSAAKKYGKRARGRFAMRKGRPRYDRAIAPQLQSKGGPNKKQEPGAYLLAIIDPEKSQSCMIPDLSSYPTVCYSVRQSFLAGSTTTGIGGIKIALFGFPGYFQENLSTTTDAAITYNAITNFVGSTVINTTYTRHRVVGASLRVEHPGSDATNQGIIVGFSGSRFDTLATPTTLATLQGCRNTLTCLLKDGIYTTYRPVDADCFDMMDTSNVSTAEDLNAGCLLVHWTGAAASQNIQLHVTIHYEGITTISTGDSEPGGQASTVNANELAETQHVAAQVDPNAPGSSYTSGQVSQAAQAVCRVARYGLNMYNDMMYGRGGNNLGHIGNGG